MCCYEECDECTKITFTGCIDCAPGYYMHNEVCLSYCPTGYNTGTGTCDEDPGLSSFIFSIDFPDIEDIVTDYQ